MLSLFNDSRYWHNFFFNFLIMSTYFRFLNSQWIWKHLLLFYLVLKKPYLWISSFFPILGQKWIISQILNLPYISGTAGDFLKILISYIFFGSQISITVWTNSFAFWNLVKICNWDMFWMCLTLPAVWQNYPHYL